MGYNKEAKIIYGCKKCCSMWGQISCPCLGDPFMSLTPVQGISPYVHVSLRNVWVGCPNGSYKHMAISLEGKYSTSCILHDTRYALGWFVLRQKMWNVGTWKSDVCPNVACMLSDYDANAYEVFRFGGIWV